MNDYVARNIEALILKLREAGQDEFQDELSGIELDVPDALVTNPVYESTSSST